MPSVSDDDKQRAIKTIKEYRIDPRELYQRIPVPDTKLAEAVAALIAGHTSGVDTTAYHRHISVKKAVLKGLQSSLGVEPEVPQAEEPCKKPQKRRSARFTECEEALDEPAHYRGR